MNKQRLTKLTRREIQAAYSGGAVDSSIPRDQIREVLEQYGPREFDLDAISRCMADEVGRARQLTHPARLEPAEVVQQAADTVAVIDELLLRLENLHPQLDAMANQTIFNVTSEWIPEVLVRIAPDIYRIRAAIRAAGAEIDAQPSTPGQKRGAWYAARDTIGRAIREHSIPAVPAKDAPALATALLEVCGLEPPRRR